jgi:hypothetical protein
MSVFLMADFNKGWMILNRSKIFGFSHPFIGISHPRHSVKLMADSRTLMADNI